MAGSWTRLENLGKKDSDTGKYMGVVGLQFLATADASDGTLPDLTLTSADIDDLPWPDFVYGIDTTFGADAAEPNNLTLIMKTAAGNTQWSPTKLTASGWSKPDSPEPVAGGFKLSAAQDVARVSSATSVVTIFIG